MRTRKTLLSVAIASIFAAPPSLAQTTTEEKKAEDAQRLGTITILGEGDALGSGQMSQEEQPKARSTTTRAALDKQRATANPYQGLELLPGVNTFSHDATGLFGGGMRVRAYNSDQMGFTVDGAPVNDSGSFAVFPQEYVDAENLCELFVTQGTPDADAPHVGASGGNMGLVTCDPLTRRGGKIQQTLGELNLSKTFVRGDTGTLNFAKGWRSFISFSHAEVDKWRGKGGADRDHIDFRTVLQLSQSTRISVTALWNDSINNNYSTGTKAQFATNYNFDFFDRCDVAQVAGCWIGNPTPVNGTRQAPAQTNGANQGIYYKLALNPFRNAIVTGKANINLTPSLRLDIEPYYWYGYGTGGVQQFNLNEVSTFRGGITDVNRDGDRLDTVMVYRSSLTNTHRPGGTVRFSASFDNHRISAGYWYERARHRQTAPATRIDSDANADDLWLHPPALILRGDGTPYQNRDQFTISTAGNFFIADTMGFMQEKLRLDVGVKAAFIDRDFTNYANEGFGQSLDYHAKKRFKDTLPNVGARYQFDGANQVFLSVAKNFKAPGNFSWQGAVIGGVNRVQDVSDALKAETAVSTDLGYRHYGKVITFSGSLFNSDFKDRLATRYVPEEGAILNTNVGDGKSRGVEFEVGTVPINGFSAYLSGTYTRSRNENDIQPGLTGAVTTPPVVQPTAGKDFPDTPRYLAGFSMQYARQLFYVNAKVKYTGKRFSTLTNDEWVPGYTTVDLNAGYLFGNLGFIRSLTIRANLSNLFDRKYLALNAGSGSLFTTNATGPAAAAPVYYAGAPRFSSLSITAEF